MDWKETEKHYTLRLDNGISMRILRKGKTFLGIGQVKHKKDELRCDELPIMPAVHTPDGHHMTQLEIDDISQDDDSVTIEMTPSMTTGDRTEWESADGEGQWNVNAWDGAEERDRGGAFRLEIKTVNRTLGGIEFEGFSYAYRFRSRKYHAWRIHDRSTWELGGYATRNAFWMHGLPEGPCKTIQNKSDEYSTAVWHPEVSQYIQFLPFFTALQGFTFQYDPHGLLVTTFDNPFHCRSLFQKPPGENYMVHWHQLCCDLGGCIEFPAHQVLYCKDEDAEELDRINQYCDIREELQRSFCQEWDLEREKTVPVGLLRGGARARSRSTSRALGAIVKGGVERVYVRRLFDGLGPTGPNQADRVDALERVVDFVNDVHHRGIEVAVPLGEVCTPWVVQALVEASAGTERTTDLDLDEVLCGVNEDDFYHHMDALRRELGIGAIFCDGAFCSAGREFRRRYPSQEAVKEGVDPRFSENGGSVRSLQDSVINLIGRLQSLGFTCPIIDTGATSGVERYISYDALKGHEHMYRDSVVIFPADDISSKKGARAHAYFRGIAHRVSFAVVCDLREAMRKGMPMWWDPDMAAMNHAWQAVREYMEDSRVLAQDRGVLWSAADPSVQVLWPFKKFTWQVGEEADIFEVMSHKKVEPAEGKLSVEPWKVYLVENAEQL